MQTNIMLLSAPGWLPSNRLAWRKGRRVFYLARRKKSNIINFWLNFPKVYRAHTAMAPAGRSKKCAVQQSIKSILSFLIFTQTVLIIKKCILLKLYILSEIMFSCLAACHEVSESHQRSERISRRTHRGSLISVRQ